MYIERRFKFPDKHHFVNKTIKLSVQNLCHLKMNISNRNAVNCVQYSLVLVTHSASSRAS